MSIYTKKKGLPFGWKVVAISIENWWSNALLIVFLLETFEEARLSKQPFSRAGKV